METSKTLQNWNQVAEIELVYKTKVKASERPFINSSKTAYQLALQSWNRDTIEFFEQFKIMLLNQSNKVLGIYEVSSGGISGTVVDLRLIFAAALKANESRGLQKYIFQGTNKGTRTFFNFVLHHKDIQMFFI